MSIAATPAAPEKERDDAMLPAGDRDRRSNRTDVGTPADSGVGWVGAVEAAAVAATGTEL